MKPQISIHSVIRAEQSAIIAHGIIEEILTLGKLPHVGIHRAAYKAIEAIDTILNYCEELEYRAKEQQERHILDDRGWE